MKEGIFVSFEGGEGGGKSTLIKMLEQHLCSLGFRVSIFREPGGVHISEEIRSILLYKDMEPLTELLLYAASRAQLVPQALRPALEEHDFVLSDRFMDSNEAYQGYGRNLDLKMVKEIVALSTNGIKPQVTYLLDLDPRLGVMRASTVTITRFEEEGLNFHNRVRKGFLAIAEREPGRIVKIDASKDLKTVFSFIVTDFTHRFLEKTR